MSRNYRTFMSILWILCVFFLGHDLGTHQPHDFAFWFNAFSAVAGTAIIVVWIRDDA